MTPDRSRRRTTLVLTALLASLATLSLATLASGHGASDARIETLSAAIRRHPDNAVLWLERGEVHRDHRQPERALADFAVAARLDPQLPRIDILRALAWIDAGRLAEARAVLEQRLARVEDGGVEDGGVEDGEARLLLGRVLHLTGDPAAAARQYDLAIGAILAAGQRPRPDSYLERSRAKRDAGDPVGAIAGLDHGIARLGAVSLHLAALEIELAQGMTTAALTRLDALCASTRRHERWTFRRAVILEHLGRTAEASAAYAAALDQIRAVPAARASAELRTLEADVHSALARLACTTPDPTE